MIQKFIAGLSDTEKKVLFVALFFAVIALFDRLLLAPTMSKLEAINQEIAKEIETIRQDRHFLKYKDRILKESKLYEPYYVEKLPSEEDIIAGFLKKIESIAINAGITLVRVSPSNGNADTNYVEYQADLECTGKVEDLLVFMHKIDTSKDLMKIVKFNIVSKKSDADEVKATMTILKMIVPTHPLVQKKPAQGDADKTMIDNGKSANKKSGN